MKSVPAGGQAIDVGRLDLWVAVAGQFRPQVIHGDEEDVVLSGLGEEWGALDEEKDKGESGAVHGVSFPRFAVNCIRHSDWSIQP